MAIRGLEMAKESPVVQWTEELQGFGEIRQR